MSSNPPNTSGSGGPLFPALPLPLDDYALDAVFQTLVANVTQLSGALVLPRWQMALPIAPGQVGGPPKKPEPPTDWCAIGITEVTQDAGPWEVYDPVANLVTYWDHETLDLLASFYGPNSQSFARLLRAGLNVPQNTEQLLPYAIRYIDCSQIRTTSELVKNQWVRRQDVSLQFRRKVTMTFEIYNLLIAEIHLQDDTVVNDTIVVPPGSPILP
jgi:hypothetical protein